MKLEDMDPKLLYTKEHKDYIECVTYVNPLKALQIQIPGWPWGDDSLSVNEVKEYLTTHPELKEESSSDHEVNMPGKDLWHIKRIKYFINHPGEIQKGHIKIWLHFKEYGQTDDSNFYYLIWDGNHRLYAAAIIGIEKIPCHFKGSEKFLKELQGK